jgi:hypothetical protein
MTSRRKQRDMVMRDIRDRKRRAGHRREAAILHYRHQYGTTG